MHKESMNIPTRVAVILSLALSALLVVLIIWSVREKSVVEIFRIMLAERWGIVTLLDLYGGFLVTSTWICVLERKPLRILPWLLGIFLLGNLATLIYILFRARKSRSLTELFTGLLPLPAAPAAR